MINIADKFHAATEEGVVASAKEIKDYQLGKDQETLNQEFNAYMNTPPEKEVVGVLTAADEAPSSPSADDLYINTDENKLYKYSGSAWVEETPIEDIVYVTADTSHLYLWNGTEFTDVTGQIDGDIIYISNLPDLNPYTNPTFKTVAWVQNGKVEYYTFVVDITANDLSPKQLLQNKDGYRYRTYRTATSSWNMWITKEYAYKVKQTEYADGVSVLALSANSVAIFKNRTQELTLNMSTSTSGEACEYHCVIEAGSTAPTINWPQNIEWNGGSEPTIVAGKTYEVSIMNGIALYVEIEPQTQSQS